MQRSLFSAVSGLRNHQTAMDVIGNNIANVNTTAFKAGRATFKESFAQVLNGASRPTGGQGGVNPLEVGLGMQLASVDKIMTQGNTENTGVTTDMAIQGNSYFVVKQGNSTYYTRAGNFQPDADGRLVSPTNGSILQGKMATNGVLNDQLTDIKIPQGQTTPAKASTRVTMAGNFDSSANVITAVDPNNPTAAELADPNNAHSVTHMTLPSGVYDSLGLTHDLTLVAWKVSPTQWDFKVDPTNVNYDNTKPYTFGPGAQSSPAAAAAPWQFTFNADGTINTASSNIPQVTFTPPGNGNAVTLTLDPGSGATGLTSYVAGTSAVLKDQDGYAAGVMTGFTIDRDGTVVGSFSNGTNETLAQVALADFNNPEGLAQAGDNMYTTSANSGSPVIGYSGRETSSEIASGSLEMSNVDLAQEFTNMIITERGFQANGKMITTSDEMLQTLISLRQ
jgi:flagellar hook protein FlgE